VSNRGKFHNIKFKTANFTTKP